MILRMEDENQKIQSEPVATPQDVNIDELEISILMLVRNPRSHETSSTFLSRRGWPTKCSNNLQAAIKLIVKERPDFVLLSLNFPHPAVAKIAPLLKQSFGVEVVFMGETLDAAMATRLAKIEGYKISGTPSGPNLQRSLRRILQEKLNPHQVSDANSGTQSQVDEIDQTVTIRGEQVSSYESVESTNYKFESAKVSGKKLKLKDFNSSPQQALSSEFSKDSDQGLAALLNQLNQLQEPEKEEVEQKYQPLKQAVLSGMSKLAPLKPNDWTGGTRHKDFFVIPVKHTTMHGFLLVSTEELSQRLRADFFEQLEKILRPMLTENFEFSLQKGVELRIPELDFKTMVSNSAIFRLSSSFGKTKFCVAFIESAEPFPEITEVKKDKMLQVSVNAISSEYPVTFKAYLKLEKNKRYYLYLKNGRHLLPEQKRRLKENNVEMICVKMIDETNMRKFLLYVKVQESMLEALANAS